MEMKTKILDKKHIIVISIIIISIIIGVISATYAYFSDRQDKEIMFGSASNFGGGTLQKTNVILSGDLSTDSRLTNANDENNLLSIKFDDVSENAYLVSLIAEVDPNETTFLEENSGSLTYEVYHKTDSTLDTSSFTCENKEYTNGENTDYCETGTFENSLDGTPLTMIGKYRINDINTHYFDVYISNKTLDTSKIKVSFYFLYKTTFKPGEEYLNEPDISNGLVPVKYVTNEEDSGNWVITTKDDEEWYNYNNQKWANAVSLDLSTDEKKAKLLNEDGTYKIGAELTLPDGTSNDSDVLAMFVWIPRFSYTIGCHATDNCYGYRMNDESDIDSGTPSQTLPGAIDIKFIKKNTKDLLNFDNNEYPNYIYDSNDLDNRTPNNWYTHPAFTFGDDELSGIWVGKFETSTAVNASCYNSATSNCVVGATEVRILPNVTSMRYQEVANQFAYSQYFSAKDNIYGLTGDAHMMKNSEWAAVAYLSQSIYGKYGNKAYSGGNKEIYINNYYNTSTDGHITGVSAGAPSTSSSSSITCRYNVEGDNRTEGTGLCGPGASTTGNIYGIYDMSGGALEYVMGYYENAISGTSYLWGATNNGDSAGFNIKPESKYFNGYQNYTIFTNSEEVVGHAIYETGNWYSDYNSNISASNPWVMRGGYYGNSSNAGAFNTTIYNGGGHTYYSFRSVLATIES